MSYYRAVAKRSELVEGDAHIVSVDGREIALFQIDGEVHALENVCPHRHSLRSMAHMSLRAET